MNPQPLSNQHQSLSLDHRDGWVHLELLYTASPNGLFLILLFLFCADLWYILQAFRHLYVLATEPRYVEAIDVDSRASVYVPLSVTMQQQTQVICLLLSEGQQHWDSCRCRHSPVSKALQNDKQLADLFYKAETRNGWHDLLRLEQEIGSCKSQCCCLDAFLFTSCASSTIHGNHSIHALMTS